MAKLAAAIAILLPLIALKPLQTGLFISGMLAAYAKPRHMILG
ncbi:hypothetical protein [Methylophaga sp. OBS4]|nr:hypothetical protein [Methylophaga sp. OBS4]MCX4187350.1 hypothetical protein [Methylophaga sp. OBS4]